MAVLKLLRIEYRKQVSNSGIWILLALHLVVLLLTSMNVNSFLSNTTFMVNNMPEIDQALKPILQFPDVWQNLTYLSGYFKIILALIVITSICNEFTHDTARQNIIDGFSRRDWLLSKIGLAKVLALISTLWVLGIGLFLGYKYGDSMGLSSAFSRMDFVLAYYVELTVYFIYAIFLALVLQRTGLSVILLLVYDFILEPILSWSLPENVGTYLPMNTIDRLNSFPFGKYVGTETLSYVPIAQLGWAVGYGLLFGVLSYWFLKKRDL